MATEFLGFSIDAPRTRAIEELASVRLLHDVRTDDGVKVPEGTEGTIVGVWAKGRAYEVEFLAGLATVEANQLEVAASGR